MATGQESGIFTIAFFRFFSSFLLALLSDTNQMAVLLFSFLTVYFFSG